MNNEMEKKIEELTNREGFTYQEDLKEMYSLGQSHMKQRVFEKIVGMKKILWNDDVKKHVENINRHNVLNELLSELSES